jgi:lipopolysaccharide transport system permease protein
MIQEIRELLRYRELVKSLVIRDLKLRYKNSILGFFWSLLNPIVQVLVYWFVFKIVARFEIRNYTVYVLCAFIPWMYFQSAILDAASSVRVQFGLLKRVYFPREALPISIVASNFIHLLLAFVVLGAYFIKVPVMPRIEWLLLPLVMILETMLILGFSLIAACLNVFYEDVKFIVTMLLNVVFFLSPVLYVWEFAQQGIEHRFPMFAPLYLLNPMAVILTMYRKVLCPPMETVTMRDGAVLQDMALPVGYMVYTVVFSVGICIIGYWIFNRYKWTFAERA